MTDKKTDNSTDEDFDLNHFEQSSETDSFADLFTDAGQAEQALEEGKTDGHAPAWGADRFAASDFAKKEPRIPQVPQPGTTHEQDENNRCEASDAVHSKEQTAIEDNEAKQPMVTYQQPSATDTSPSAPTAEQRSGTKSITIFAILAMLIAAIAVWLNPGASSDSDASDPLKSQSVLASDVQIQRLESRLSSLEQRSNQQRVELNQQIQLLQQQVSKLTEQASRQAEKQHPIRHTAIRAAKKSKPAHHPSTAPLLHGAATGWVVNLASVDSKHAATKALSRYKAQGIRAEIHAARVKGKIWFRLRVAGFANKQEASAQKNFLAEKFGIKGAWVQKP